VFRSIFTPRSDGLPSKVSDENFISKGDSPTKLVRANSAPQKRLATQTLNLSGNSSTALGMMPR
jgi:hypothetical protein